jgi:invasion protein IalB
MKSFSIVAFAAALLVAPAFAQDAPQQAQKPLKPSEEKLFQDWTVRCFPVSSPTPCEMIELRVAKKTGQRVLGVLMAYVPARDTHILQISVPLGVALANGLVINAAPFKSSVLKFRRCDQLGCYVETAVGNDVIGQLSKAPKGQVEIVTVDGRHYNLAFSMDGFNDAHAALVELSKAKVKAPSAPPAEPQP